MEFGANGPVDFAAHIPTRAKVKQQREQEAEGYWFPLRLTGGFARVRVWSIADRAMFARLPQSIQALLAEELDRSNKNQQPRGTKETVARLNAVLGDQETLCNHFVHLGFLQPRVVLTEADIDPADPYCIVASDIHIEERLEYLALVLDGEASAAKKLRPFRAGPVADVPGESGDEAAPAAEPLPLLGDAAP